MKHAGLSEHGAAGLVARWAAVEASGGPGSRNPRSGAEGIGQWLGSRKRPGITDVPDFEGQLKHAAEELMTTERRAGDVLRNAKTADEGSRGASMYERAEGYNPRTGRDNFTNATPTDSVWARRFASGRGVRPVEAGMPGYVPHTGQVPPDLRGKKGLPLPGEKSPYGGLYPLEKFNAPPAPSTNSFTSSSIRIDQKNEFNVSGVSDPSAAAAEVEKRLNRTNAGLTRNLEGAAR